MYVQVGNLAKIQQNGTLTFSVPKSGGPLTFMARRVEAESDQNFVWTGVSGDGLYQAIFMNKDGKLSGSFESKQGNYQLYAIEAGVSILMEVDLSKLGECDITGKTKSQTPVTPNGGRQDACQEATRVLILYTQAASNLVPDVNQVADLSIQQYNNALNNSDIGNRITNTLINAGVAYISYTETNDATYDAAIISQRADAQALRNQYNADIVVTLTGTYATSFGSVVSSNDIPASNNTAYAVVVANQASLVGAYTFAHETGHLFGGRHDGDPNGPSYVHGYQLPGQSIRTIMSVRNAGDLSRILYYSNPNVSFNGTPTGTVTNNDVARRIGETSSTIVNFRSSVSSSFNASIDGTSSIYSSGSYPFEVAYQCISPNFYEWSVSTDGFNFGSPIGYSEQINPYISSSNNGLYYLRCRITLPGGQVYTTRKYVSVNICDGCRTGSEATALTLTTSPNPTATSAINVNFTLSEQANVSMTLTDGRAISIKKLDLGALSPGDYQKQMDVAGLNPGLYIVSLQAGSQMRSQKVLITK